MHYPLPRTKLASLVKGRWLDDKAQIVALLRFTCDMSVFFYSPNFSAVKTEGLSHNPRPYQSFQNRTITLDFRKASVCVCLVGSAALQSPLSVLIGIKDKHFLKKHTFPQTKIRQEHPVGFHFIYAFLR